MRASYQWLRELSGISASAEEYSERLTQAGIEVEAMTRHGESLNNVVVAEVRGKRPHPNRDKLSLVNVFDGVREQEVVCGAPNVPEAGRRVLFARLGAKLPGGIEISERELGGVKSRGMICSETELQIGSDQAGIFVLGAGHPARPGQPVADALGLRDAVFELSLTPNRPDCLGHVGVARELAVLFNRPFELPAVDVFSASPDSMDVDGIGRLAVSIRDPERCPRYAATLVRGIQVGPSPFWLRYRLHLLGIRSLSNAVDVTNLILLEWGHPIHGFDLRYVRNQRIEARRALAGEMMSTLDGAQRTFVPDDLLICDGMGPVAVAGVMGGLESELRDDTQDVLIECAYFNPRSVRRTARRLGLHTESSHRFERGVDPNGVPRVASRAAALMASLCNGTVHSTMIDNYPNRMHEKIVVLRRPKLEAVLGLSVPVEKSKRVLEGLGCDVTECGSDELEAVVPTWRPDLAREEDLIEEVIRVHGFDHIPTTIPRVRPSRTRIESHGGLERELRALGASAGLQEVITYAFVSVADLRAARVPTDAVRIANPLSEDKSVMRTSLLPGLAHVVRHAQNRQVETVRVFEVARAFHPQRASALPVERRWLAALLVGQRPGWIKEESELDFFDGKAVIERLVRRVGRIEPAFVIDDGALDREASYLHPKRRAVVNLLDESIGYLGELHPDVVDALELGGRPIYLELDVERLARARKRVGVVQAKSAPRFPAVVRDIAMVVPERHPAGTIAQAMREASTGLVEHVTLFDLYRGEQVPDGHKSLAFRLVYRNPDQTLTDREVDQIHGRLTTTVKTRFRATIR